MESLARLCRALANYQRLAIIRLLVVAGELRVSAIAEALDAPQPSVSNELRVLVTNGVIWQRRSGKSVFYSVARSKGDPRRHIIEALVSAFSRKQRGKKSLADVAGWSEAEGECPADDEIFAFLTAFTHPRRLQILRWLAEHGSGAKPAIASDLAMSPNACGRHLAKLQRRGVVVRYGEGPDRLYRVGLSSRVSFGPRLLQKVLNHVKAMGGDPTHVNV